MESQEEGALLYFSSSGRVGVPVLMLFDRQHRAFVLQTYDSFREDSASFCARKVYYSVLSCSTVRNCIQRLACTSQCLDDEGPSSCGFFLLRSSVLVWMCIAMRLPEFFIRKTLECIGDPVRAIMKHQHHVFQDSGETIAKAVSYYSSSHCIC